MDVVSNSTALYGCSFKHSSFMDIVQNNTALCVYVCVCVWGGGGKTVLLCVDVV